MNKRRQTSVDSRIRVLLTLLFTFAFITGVKAQDYVVTSAETWHISQTLSTNVIVDAGGTLTIDAGVQIGFNYADVNNDNIGDFKLEVRNGGVLIINGTPSNPVVFQGVGSNPPVAAGDNKWWQGITVSGTGSSTLGFFTVKNANNGVTVNNGSVISGLTVDGSVNGITVANTGAGTVELNGVTLTNLTGKGIIINSGAAIIRNPTITNITDNGIEVNSPNVTIDWPVITNAGTGIYNSATATSTVVTNANVTGNKKSGLFNLDGTVAISNSVFNSNAFHGVVNSSGTVTISQSDLCNNVSRGLLAAGAGTTTVRSVTDTANGNVGVEINPAKQVADVLVPAGTAETPMPNVSFLYSNIYSNSKTVSPASVIQVKSLATSATPTADFTTNWWGFSTGIINYVSMTTPNSVNYINWKISGAYTPGATAILNPTKKMTITYPSDSQKMLIGQNVTVTWTSTGNVPFVAIKDSNVTTTTLLKYAVVANTGSYTYQFGGANTNDHYIIAQAYSSDSLSTIDLKGVVGVTSALKLNKPIATDTVYGNKTAVVNWVAPSTVEKVTIVFKPAPTSSDTTILASNIDATLGTYTVTIPNVASTATGVFRIVDVTTSYTAGWSTNDSSNAVVTIATPPVWSYSYTGSSMNLAIDTVTFLPYGAQADPLIPVENSDTYVGAFWLNPSGQAVCAGYTRGFSPTTYAVAGTAAITGYAAAPASRAATHTVVTAANVTGLVNGDIVNIVGSTVVAYNGNHAVSTIAGNTFEIEVPFTADGGASTWTEYGAATSPLGYRPLTIWGDDATTSSVKEGPAEGDKVYFKVWRQTWGTSDSTLKVAAYNDGVTSTFAGDSTYILYSKDASSVLDSLFFRRGTVAVSSDQDSTVFVFSGITAGKWFLFSSFVNPTTKTIVSVTDSLRYAPTDSSLVLVKNSAGQVYWPQYGINQIDPPTGTGFDVRQAYYMKLSNATEDTIKIYGTRVTPETTPINLVAGWNYTAYLRKTEMNIATALSSIAEYLVIVKDDSGKVYWPAYSINEIGNMKPGRGYLIKMNQADILTYPANSASKTLVASEFKNTVHYIVEANSDNSSTIAILASALNGKVQVNDEIGVFNSDGVLVGSAVYNGGNVGVVVWGLESGAKKGFGMAEGEAYTIKVWSKASGKETLLAGAAYTMGTGLYSSNGVSVISKVEGLKSAIPTEYAISQNYPNPFNPSTVISYALPTDSRVKISVYNILGQLVRELVNTDMKAGYHQVNFNAAGLASGVYMYQIDAGNFHMTKKMNLLK